MSWDPKRFFSKLSVTDVLIVFLGTFALRFVFHAHIPTEWDSVNLTMGVNNFDVVQGSPHAPGYYLFVMLARLVKLLTPLSASQSAIFVTMVASAATSAVLYLVGAKLGGRRAGWLLAALAAFSPFFWFYGSMVNTYAFDALAASILILCLLNADRGSRAGYAAVITWGLAGGTRQSSLVFFAPLVAFIFAISVDSWKYFAKAAGLAIGCIAIWFLPMVWDQPGGYAAIKRETDGLFGNAESFTSWFGGGKRRDILTNTGRSLGAMVVPFLFFAPVAIILYGFVIATRDKASRAPYSKKLLIGLGLLALPAALFNTFIHFGKTGYVLPVLPALFVVLAIPFFAKTKAATIGLIAVLALYIPMNTFQFVHAAGAVPGGVEETRLWFTQKRFDYPWVITNAAINRTDSEARKYEAIREVAKKNDVVIFYGDEGGFRFRQQTFLNPHLVLRFWQPRGGYRLAYESRWKVQRNAVAEVGPGGKAFIVSPIPDPEIDRLVGSHQATKVTLSTGATVWAVHPGTKFHELKVVENSHRKFP